jgi:hypothetical protein
MNTELRIRALQRQEMAKQRLIDIETSMETRAQAIVSALANGDEEGAKTDNSDPDDKSCGNLEKF